MRSKVHFLLPVALLVPSARCDGVVQLVDIQSRRGETCRLRNPWKGPCDVIEMDGKARVLSGDILRFDTRAGGVYRVSPRDKPMPNRQRQ